jgi:hypothetical protein
MAAPAARKQNTPAELVERIRKDLDVAELRLAQCERARTEFAEASITDPDAVAKFEEARRSVEIARGEIDRLKTAFESAQEKARAAEAERLAKDRAVHIEAVEAKLGERTTAVAELADAVKQADTLFRRVCSLSREVDSAWAWQPHDRVAIGLPPGSILQTLRHEIFRVGGRPHLLGGQDRDPEAGIDYPGGQSPTLELKGTPHLVKPMVEVFREAAECASGIMRTGKSTSGATMAFTTPETGVPAALRKDKPPLTPAQQRLAELLRRQAELAAADPSPENEAAYQDCVSQIAAAQAGTDGAGNRESMAAAQKRLNEIDRAFPRRESTNPNSATVMESDAEWLARNPHVAAEWRRLWQTAKGGVAA